MTKYLWIPVVGTIAALVAVLIFSRERGTPQADAVEGLSLPSNAPAPLDWPEVDATPPAPIPDPEPKPTEWSFVVHSDGSLRGATSEERYESIAEVSNLLKAEAAARPKVILGQGEGVSEQKLEEAAAVLRTHCDIRIIRRGNQQTPPKDK